MEKTILFSYQKTSCVTERQLLECARLRALDRKITALQQGRQKQFRTCYAAINVPFEKSCYQHVKQTVAKKMALKPSVIVVIGIGGSSLGTKAVQEALLGRFYNAGDPHIRIYFAQTVDADRVAAIAAVVESEIIKGHAVLLNVVTKSGTTIETIANFQVLCAIIKKYFPETYAHYIVVTTDKDSVLYKTAQQEKFALLEIPQLVGGRYSVFTAVGLFPLMMLGIDCEQLLSGAQAAVKQALSKDLLRNPAALGALIMFLHAQQGLNIHDLFLFSVDLEGVGKWYRQLLAESVGKERDLKGARVLAGITPTVSIGSVDLHSVAQLYLGGPRDKLTTFVTVKKLAHRVVIPSSGVGETITSLKGKHFSKIMHAIAQGTKLAYHKNKRPFCSIELPEKNEQFIGQFLQMKMIETIYLAHLMEVDPFDQPNVDLYKRETARLLGQ